MKQKSTVARALRGAVATGWIVLVAACLAACAHRPEIRDRRVLVMDFDSTVATGNAEKDAGFGSSLAEMLTGSLVNYPRIAVVDRQGVGPLLAEARNKPERWRELGDKIGVDYVIVGSASRLDRNFVVNSRLLSVSTGEIVKGSSITRSCRREEDLYPVMQSMARVMAAHLKVLAERHDELARK